MPHCQSCNAEIIWAVTGNGKGMPLDKEPRHDGNIHLTMEEGDTAPTAIVLSKQELVKRKNIFPNALFYMPHWATCPNSKHHRKDKS